ncbi:MAG: hypothetical protein ACR2MQ_08435 [Gemmatimonadaceae bacterium]
MAQRQGNAEADGDADWIVKLIDGYPSPNAASYIRLPVETTAAATRSAMG